MKNKTTSAEMIFQDVRKSNEEMTSSDVKKVTKMDQKWVKMDQNGPSVRPRAPLGRPGRWEVTGRSRDTDL